MTLMSRNKHTTNKQWNINKLKHSGNYMYKKLQIWEVYIIASVYLCVPLGSHNKLNSSLATAVRFTSRIVTISLLLLAGIT
jgi:hypothetical protein